MLKALEEQLQALGHLPSAPRIARELHALARHPEVSTAQVSSVLSHEPALASKILRLANSLLYARPWRCYNVRQALSVVGVSSALTLCLGFSIAASLRGGRGGALDYRRYWRGAVLAALGSRCLGEELGLPPGEDLFLAGLLQDIGMIALDRSIPKFYLGLAENATHAEQILYEREHLQEDHAAIGAWLLRTWGLPDALCEAVERSHLPEALDLENPAGRFVRCMALGDEISSAFLSDNSFAALAGVQGSAVRLLSLSDEQLVRIVRRVMLLAPDLGEVFDTTLLTAESGQRLAEAADALLGARSGFARE